MIKIKKRNKNTSDRKNLYLENLRQAEQFYSGGLKFQEKLQISEAINCFLKAIELNPDFVDAYISLGSIIQEKGRVDEAVGDNGKCPKKDNLLFPSELLFPQYHGSLI